MSQLRCWLGPALGSVALIFCLSSSASAAATYSYTGYNYAAATGLPYTTSMATTAVFTVTDLLAGNLLDVDLLPDVLSFSLSDGVNTWTDASSIDFADFHVSTDAFGAIYEWSFDLVLTNGSQVSTCNTGATITPTGGSWCVAGNDNSAAAFDAVSLQGAYLFPPGDPNPPGTFELVPEPSTGLLLVMGFVGLAGWRRVKQG